MPSYAAIAPIAQHRGREPQLACDLDQRPTAARQQGDRLRLELIRKMTPFLDHSTPSRSCRSLAKVSTNSGEAQVAAHPVIDPPVAEILQHVATDPRREVVGPAVLAGELAKLRKVHQGWPPAR